jgi:murein DD-endopeptidase MepM/ murein hydrolase activator NlpD
MDNFFTENSDHFQLGLGFSTEEARAEMKEFAQVAKSSLEEVQAEVRVLGTQLEKLKLGEQTIRTRKTQSTFIPDEEGNLKRFTLKQIQKEVEELTPKYTKLVKTMQEMILEQNRITTAINKASRANQLFEQGLDKQPQKIREVKEAYQNLEAEISRLEKLRARTPTQDKHLADLHKAFKLEAEDLHDLIELEKKHADVIEKAAAAEKARAIAAKARLVEDRNRNAINFIQGLRPEQPFRNELARQVREQQLQQAFNSPAFQRALDQQAIKNRVLENLNQSRIARNSSFFSSANLDKLAAQNALARKAENDAAKEQAKKIQDLEKLRFDEAVKNRKHFEAVESAARKKELDALKADILERNSFREKAEKDSYDQLVKLRKEFESREAAARKRELEALKADIIARSDAFVKQEKLRYDQAVAARKQLEKDEAAARRRQLDILKADILARAKAQIDAEKAAAKASSKDLQATRNQPFLLDREVQRVTSEYLKATRAAEALKRANKGIATPEFKQATEIVERYRQRLTALVETSKKVGNETANVARAQAALAGALGKSSGGFGAVLNTISKVGFAFYGLQAAIYAIQAPLAAINTAFIDTNRRLGEAELAIAATFNNQVVETFEQSLIRAKGFVKELRDEAVKTNLTFNELFQIAEVALPQLLSKGATEEQALKILSLIGQQSKLVLGDRFEPGRVSDEVRALLNKQITGRTNETLVSLGITKADLKNVKDMTDLVQLLENKTKGLTEANKVFQREFGGAIDRLKDKFFQLGAELGKPLFDSLTKGLNEFNDALERGDYDNVIKGIQSIITGTVNLTHSLIDLGKQASETLGEKIPGTSITLGEFLTRLAVIGATTTATAPVLGPLAPLAGVSVGLFGDQALAGAAAQSRRNRFNQNPKAAISSFTNEELRDQRNDLLNTSVFPIGNLNTAEARRLVTSPFGVIRNGKTHKGVDIGVPVGTELFSPFQGTARVTTDPKGGLGLTITGINKAGEQISTSLYHLSKVFVQTGDIISAGTKVALSGGQAGAPGAGDSSGPHVHIESRVNGNVKNPFNTVLDNNVLRGDSNRLKAQISAIDREISRRNKSKKVPDADRRFAPGALGTEGGSQASPLDLPNNLKKGLNDITVVEKAIQDYERALQRVQGENSQLQASLDNLSPDGIEKLRVSMEGLQKEQAIILQSQKEFDALVGKTDAERKGLETQFNKAVDDANKAITQANAAKTPESREIARDLVQQAQLIRDQYSKAQQEYEKALDQQRKVEADRIQTGIKLIQVEGDLFATAQRQRIETAKLKADLSDLDKSFTGDLFEQAVNRVKNSLEILRVEITNTQEQIDKMQGKLPGGFAVFTDPVTGNVLNGNEGLNPEQRAALEQLKRLLPTLKKLNLQETQTRTDGVLDVAQQVLSLVNDQIDRNDSNRGLTQKQRDARNIAARQALATTLRTGLTQGSLFGQSITNDQGEIPPELRRQLEALVRENENATLQIKDAYRVNVIEAGESAFNQFFDSVLNGTASFKDAFIGFIKDIATQIERLLSRALFDKINQALFKGQGGFTVGAPQVSIGGAPTAQTNSPAGIMSFVQQLFNKNQTAVAQGTQQGIQKAILNPVTVPNGLSGSVIPDSGSVAKAGSALVSLKPFIGTLAGAALFAGGQAISERAKKPASSLAGVGLSTAGGALAGASIGSIVPGIGTAIGAIIGGTIGAGSGISTNAKKGGFFSTKGGVATAFALGGPLGFIALAARKKRLVAERAAYQDNVLQPFLDDLVGGADPLDEADLRARIVEASRGKKARGSRGMAMKREAQTRLKKMLEDLTKQVEDITKEINDQISEFSRNADLRGIAPDIRKSVDEFKKMLKMGVDKNKVFELFNLQIRDLVREAEESLDDVNKQISQGAENQKGELISIQQGLQERIAEINKQAKKDLESLREGFAQEASAIVNEGAAAPITLSATSRQERLAILSAKQQQQEKELMEDTQNSILRDTNQTNREIADLTKEQNTILSRLSLILETALSAGAGLDGFNTAFIQALKDFTTTFNPFQSLTLAPALNGGIGINIDNITIGNVSDAEFGARMRQAIDEAKRNQELQRTAQQA